VTTLSKTKRQSLNDLKDRETRQIFQSEHTASAIPIQIRELRKKRKLTQKTLAKLLVTDQSNISNWENPNYEYTPQIGTLERLANAFDVPLIVRFGSWAELWDWENNLSPERLAPSAFPEALPELEATLVEPNTAKIITLAPGMGKTAMLMKLMNTGSRIEKRRSVNDEKVLANQISLSFMEQPQIAEPIGTMAEVFQLKDYQRTQGYLTTKNIHDDEKVA
jgi:transcriptional regulator with XRE-family HTH domain